MNKRTTERYRKCFTAAEKINLFKGINKVSITAVLVFLVMALTACSQQEIPDASFLENPLEISSEATKESAELLSLGQLTEIQDIEEIGNQIPHWVMDADWDWTQEQSDAVCLGQGIEIINLDGGMRESRAVYYPIILKGVIVSIYEVFEDIDSQELHFQAAPYFVNELNVLMSMTSADTPLILGYNNDNLIGIIGDTYYLLDIDHMYHKQVDVDEIPAIENDRYTVVNVMESLCTERTADVEDWHVLESVNY